MKKNDVIELQIEDLGIHGEGIGHAEGMTFFVQGTIPGDCARVGITKLKKSYAYGRLIELISPSENRVTPVCSIAKQCGGCQIQEMEYQAQLQWKQDLVTQDLVRIGGFDEEFITSITEPIIGMEHPWNYRNKAQYPVGRGRDGEIRMGFYAMHSHRIIELPEGEICAIGHESHGKILTVIKNWMSRAKVLPYDETTGEGHIRHILLRQGVHTSEQMVCLVSTTPKLPDIEGLTRELLAVCPEMVSLCVNVNKKNTNVILGDTTKTLWGADTIRDTVCGNTFEISPRSFFQVNPEQMEKLYQKALDYANLSGAENVYDLYCGIGTISLALAKKAGHVDGVEIVPDAIRDAKKNAERNGYSHVDFYCGPTEDVLPRLVSEGKASFGKLSEQELRLQAMGNAMAAAEGDSSKIKTGRKADVIVLDPPRKGCEPSVLETIHSVEPERIVYVSCDPATLARDLKILCESGEYELQKVCAVDQFSHSVHVETVVLMSKVNPNK